MNTPDIPQPLAIKKIFLPSDFTEASERAFQHALRIALAAKARLTVLHVSEQDGTDWPELHGVRHWLERWSLIPPGSSREAVAELGLAVQKVMTFSNDSVQACLHYLEKHPTGLIVLATHEHEGRAAWLHRSHAEPIAREAALMALFLPENGCGFVGADDGAVRLKHVVVPIAAEPNPQMAVNTAAQFAATLGLDEAAFHVVHVGDRAAVPPVTTPARPGWTWHCDVREGEVVEGILAAANEHRADLIVMATDGHHGFLDALRGNTTERVLRHSPCPLLAIPG